MACDLRITGQDAKFALPEVRLGVVPGVEDCSVCRSWWDPPEPCSSCIFGEPIDAREAERIGLVNEVVP